MDRKMKFAVMLVTIFMLFIVSACGGGSENTSAPASETSAGAATTEETPVVNVPLSDGLPDDVAKAWAETVKAAEAKELNIVSHNTSQFTKLIDTFKETFPDINVKLLSIPPQDYAPRIVSEQQNNQFLFDVVIGPVSNVSSIMIPAGALQELPPFLMLPDVTDDSKWNGGFDLYTTEKPYALVYNQQADSGVFINREFITEEQVNSLQDLLKPELKGKIVNYDMERLAGGTATLATIAKREGEQFLIDLLEQDIVNTSDTRLLVQWLVQGKYPIALTVNRSELNKFQKEGIGKDVIRLTDAFIVDYGVGVLNNAPNPDGAKVFVNWLLSKEGQEAVLAADENWNSRRTDVPIQNPDAKPDYNDIDRYVNMSDPAQQPQIKRAIELYREHAAK